MLTKVTTIIEWLKNDTSTHQEIPADVLESAKSAVLFRIANNKVQEVVFVDKNNVIVDGRIRVMALKALIESEYGQNLKEWHWDVFRM